jgi:acetyl-CoA carboxylase biotin carboxylase subunit
MEYDPMISKVIAFGISREEAIERMLRALSEYYVSGIATNVRVFRQILRDSDFRAGKFDVNYLEPLRARLKLKGEKGNSERQALNERTAAIAASILQQNETVAAAEESDHAPFAHNSGASSSPSKWKRAARDESLRQ